MSDSEQPPIERIIQASHDAVAILKKNGGSMVIDHLHESLWDVGHDWSSGVRGCERCIAVGEIVKGRSLEPGEVGPCGWDTSERGCWNWIVHLPVEATDLLEFDELVRLVGAKSPQTVKNIVSKWRTEYKREVNFPVSYFSIRDLLLKQWHKRESVFSENIADVRAFLDQRR